VIDSSAGRPTEAERARRPSWRYARAVAFGLLGGSLAAAYAHFVGCKTGTCPITSSVWTASLYGLGIGALVGWPDRRG
jgi:hypothetical protein